MSGGLKPPGRDTREDRWECVRDPEGVYHRRAFSRLDFVGTLWDGYWTPTQ